MALIHSECKILFILLLFFSTPLVGHSQSMNEKFILFDFENGLEKKEIETIDAHCDLVEMGSNHALKVYNEFNHRASGVVLQEPSDKPWNLNGFHQIKADVTNVGEEFLQVEMFVGNDPDGLTRWYCSDYVDLMPNETKTITVYLSWTPWIFSPPLEIAGMRGVPGKIKTNLDAIDQIRFGPRYATAKNEFMIDNVRAVGEVETRSSKDFFPFIDEFGQYMHKDWIGKIYDLPDLKEAASKEDKDLEQVPNDRNKYGGWLAGPKFEATGFFRSEKHDGKWWMVDPEGYFFWSAGINCVRSSSGLTGVESREHYFKNLPQNGDDLSQFYGKGTWASHGFYKGKVPYTIYNFYRANMYRKYGLQWPDRFKELTHKRFKSWGMNTFGNVSDMSAARQQKTPYTGTVWIEGTPKIEGSEGFWGKFHDVFDPRFREAVRNSMNVQKEGAGDPWCIGFFVDNEMSWGRLGSLSKGVLMSSANQVAKVEFLRDLKEKYNSIAALNKVWGTTHNSWNELLESKVPPGDLKAKEDLIAFYEKIALTYFRTIKEELAVIAPNQYYLGCRFAWSNNDVTIRSAAKYCDIVSFNKYEYSVENISLPSGVDKPIMIGEFHFGALDRGSFHVGIKMANGQVNRGELFQSYIQGALRNPFIVGAHWFQYTDQALTGRQDGENYNIGFVDICDTPYYELIDKVRETTYPMYEYRMDSDKVKHD